MCGAAEKRDLAVRSRAILGVVDSRHGEDTTGDPEQRDPRDRPVACAVCAEVLHVITKGAHGEILGYEHAAEVRTRSADRAGVSVDWEPTDHMAVPVGVEEVRAVTKCDFCSALRPGWVLPTRRIVTGTGDAMTPGWLACDPCARLLKKGRWSDLSERSLREIAARRDGGRISEERRASIVFLHGLVREHQTGPVRRFAVALPPAP